MSKHVLDRRTVLRGAVKGTAAALALPCLEAMVNGNGNVYADGKAFPQRFVVWYFGCGVMPKLWIPRDTGPNWTPVTNAINAPIATNPRVKANVSLLTGLESKGGGSHYAISTVLSGEYAAAGYESPTMDVVVSREWKSPTKFPSLVLAVSRGHKPGEGFPNISYNGSRNPNQPEYSPLKLYNRLFTAGLSDAGHTADDVLKARKSMLDTVVADSASLRGRLGATDRTRLDQHLDNVRTIEKQLVALPSCAAPPVPADAPPTGFREDLAPIDQAMTDLLALAFACDLTRVASYAFTTEETGSIFYQLGATAGYHEGLTHRSTEGNNAEMILKVMTFQISRFATFVDRFAGLTEGGGSLLDNCCIYGSSAVSDPVVHRTDELPIMLAGRAGGKLRTGLHYRSTTKESTTKVLLTMLRALGIQRTEFGVGVARTTETISAIET